jgi:hypothetical protein
LEEWTALGTMYVPAAVKVESNVILPIHSFFFLQIFEQKREWCEEGSLYQITTLLRRELLFRQ